MPFKKLSKRTPGLIAIVIYKALTALLLGTASISLLLTLQNYQSFVNFSENYTLVGKIEIIKRGLEKFLNLNPKTLQFAGIATAIYSMITIIETSGLWYQKGWARILVLGLVGISIPAEILELFAGISILKLVIFLVNIAVFWYLLRHV